VTKRRHVTVSFNEIRQILNLSQVMAVCGWSGTLPPPAPSNSDTPDPPQPFTGPDLVTFDGDQTLYSDGGNFESNPKLARALALMLKNGISIAVVTAAGYEYDAAKYTLRLSGLLKYFKSKQLTSEECGRFYVMGGECNYLLRLAEDYTLGPVKEAGPGGWVTSTKHLKDSPGNWSEPAVTKLLDIAEKCLKEAVEEMKIRGRVIRKKRAVGLIPSSPSSISRENLDECALRVQSDLYAGSVAFDNLPYCAFNGGSDCWVDVGNKRVGVEILQAYLGLEPSKCLHVGDQFLNTGNDYAARGCAPCAWITSPVETTYILKRLLIFAGGVNIDEEGVNGSAVGPGGSARRPLGTGRGARAQRLTWTRLRGGAWGG
jgi:IMP and pyridine-specific 5'-nucleotidase